ncbi:hypothetical protein PQJ75_29665 [Rhodoplanes sp. TEM]|uniref:Uncharacterized protein n=1 Tax=Rhodoplanes tepidamans TaxID=200616 RepID=A0ABT5JBI7_RHOTP|nr:MULTISPECIES: hypothetical protein [Rhodoplanes]MDC7787050.1 hypothetical protein [Rhodoplanes tepidamans]MDC7987922.1 hypothetical protein [Rhodoplanes sp. TEM]MDQ0359062.1 hypothetical protein [Rhodoplanes tepidamans]
MGTIISFPADRHVYDGRSRNADEPATIIILPVVRVDRHDDPRDGLRDGGSAARKGRRPTARR